MANQFLIKKGTDQASGKIKWQAMEAAEFNAFRKSAEGKGRYFIEFGDITIEATEAQYRVWKAEREHANYLNRQKKKRKIVTVSLSAVYMEEQLRGENVVPDEGIDVEASTISIIEVEELRNCLRMLDKDSLRLITELFLSANGKDEAELAREFGISQQAVNARKKKILKNLKISICKNQKKSADKSVRPKKAET